MPDQARDHFDAVAHRYIRREWVTSAEIRERTLAFWPTIRSNARILELGVGTGEFLKNSTGVNMLHVGLDLSRNMLMRARQSVPESRLVQGDMEALPFGVSTFDLIACRKALRFCELETVLQEAHRVCRSRGYLLFAETCAVDLQHKALIDQMIAMTEPHQRPFHTASEFTTACERVGFTVLRADQFTERRILTKAYCFEHYRMTEAQVVEYWRFLASVPDPLKTINGLTVIDSDQVEVTMHWIVVLAIAGKEVDEIT
jgi:ubiquinone/menaquinone biosynthesis C-methylase UbiE